MPWGERCRGTTQARTLFAVPRAVEDVTSHARLVEPPPRMRERLAEGLAWLGVDAVGGRAYLDAAFAAGRLARQESGEWSIVGPVRVGGMAEWVERVSGRRDDVLRG
jgi:hypothetical protein